MKTLHLSRFSASGVHFLISLTLFSLLFLTIITQWYPQPLFSAAGGWQGIKIVAFIDLVLGPVVTLAIYNPLKSKKTLFTDMSIIVLIQFSALAYGVITIYSQRPVALVFWENRFYTIEAKSLTNQNIELDKLNQFPKKNGITFVYAEYPKKLSEKKAMLDLILNSKVSPIEQLNLYRPINTHLKDIFTHSLNINKVLSANNSMSEQLQAILKQTKSQQKDLYYQMLESKYQNIILVFNQQADLIGFLNTPLKTG